MTDDKRAIFKAAAVQAAPVLRDEPVWFDLQATLEKACRLISEAGGNGARLIVFPEGFLPTHPYWSVNADEPHVWTVLWKEFVNNAVEVPGPETEALCRSAREANAYVVMGMCERDRDYGGRLYNSALFISPVEGVLGVHRKLNPTLWEMLYHTRGDGGDNLKIYNTGLGKIGGLICGEHIQLPLIHHMIVQGEQINCSLWPGSRQWSLNTEIQVTTRAVCLAGAMFGVSACACIPEAFRPTKFYPNSCLDRRGGSSIIDPMGDYIAGPIYDVETIVYGDIDLSAIALSKSVHNVTGSYSRWDLFSLGTRQKPYDPITSLESFDAGTSQTKADSAQRIEERVMALERHIEAIKEELKRSKECRNRSDRHVPRKPRSSGRSLRGPI
jgi:nitrilase